MQLENHVSILHVLNIEHIHTNTTQTSHTQAVFFFSLLGILFVTFTLARFRVKVERAVETTNLHTLEHYYT